MQPNTDFGRAIINQSDFGRVNYSHSSPDMEVSSLATVTPSVYFTESMERYAGIDVDYFRALMTPYDFGVFVDFVGGEELGLIPEDFEEIYYPEGEE